MDRNYFAHGGKELVIGGKVTFLPGATVEGVNGLTEIMPEQAFEYLPPYLPDSRAATVAALREDVNRLMQVMRTAGILAMEQPKEADDDPDG